MDDKDVIIWRSGLCVVITQRRSYYSSGERDRERRWLKDSFSLPVWQLHLVYNKLDLCYGTPRKMAWKKKKGVLDRYDYQSCIKKNCNSKKKKNFYSESLAGGLGRYASTNIEVSLYRIQKKAIHSWEEHFFILSMTTKGGGGGERKKTCRKASHLHSELGGCTTMAFSSSCPWCTFCFPPRVQQPWLVITSTKTFHITTVDARYILASLHFPPPKKCPNKRKRKEKKPRLTRCSCWWVWARGWGRTRRAPVRGRCRRRPRRRSGPTAARARGGRARSGRPGSQGTPGTPTTGNLEQVGGGGGGRGGMERGERKKMLRNQQCRVVKVQNTKMLQSTQNTQRKTKAKKKAKL